MHRRPEQRQFWLPGVIGATRSVLPFIALLVSAAMLAVVLSIPTSAAPTDTGFLGPSAQVVDVGDGFEVDPSNAFFDDALFASNINGAGDKHRFSGYAVSIPPGAAIDGIEVRLDWWVDDTAGVNSSSVELSWDGGITWTTAQTDVVPTAVEHSASLGGPADTWGRTWVPGDLGDPNFVVRVTSNSDDATRDFFLDWVPIRVFFTPPATPTPTDTPTDTATPMDTPTPTD